MESPISDVNLSIDNQTKELTQDPDDHQNPFSNWKIRQEFVRKIYLIFLIEHILTSGFINLYVRNYVLESFAIRNKWVIFIPFTLSIFSILPILIFKNLRNKKPYNFILIIIFSLTKSFYIGYATTFGPNYDFSIKIFATTIGFAIIGLILLTYKLQTEFAYLIEIGYVALICFLGICYEPYVLNFPIYKLISDGSFLMLIIIGLYLLLGDKLRKFRLLNFHITSDDYIFVIVLLYLVIYFINLIGLLILFIISQSFGFSIFKILTIILI